MVKFSFAITKASTKIHRKGKLYIYQIYYTTFKFYKEV